MLGRVIGALVGREIDRRDGSGGLKGALLGSLAVGGLRRMGPLGMALGGAYVAKKALDRRRAGRAPRV
jgi:ribulose 1,5-bisphosphate synthetase/thiazole synthase